MVKRTKDGELLEESNNNLNQTHAKRRGRPKKVITENISFPEEKKVGESNKIEKKIRKINTNNKKKIKTSNSLKNSEQALKRKNSSTKESKINLRNGKKVVNKNSDNDSEIDSSKKKPLIGVVSLGCDKNRVDTENMLTLLKNAGYKFTNDPQKAEIIVINTCCFIKSARDESEDAIAEMSEYKKRGSCKKLIVSGCLPQYDIKSLRNEFPEVDALIGINEYKNIVEIVDSLLSENKKIRVNSSPMCLDYVKNRVTTTPSYLAYLKIADGCNNFCSFCTIPYIRGRYRSRDIESLVEEASSLVAHGAREIVLVAQDTTRYGIDLYGKPRLVELLQKLSEISGLVWIRLLYCYPEMVSDDLINEIANNPKVCNYIDVPFQHVSTSILNKMNRRCNYEYTVSLIKKLKKEPNFISIRTTYMVGFPGETKKDFKLLYNFIKHNKLSNVGFFAYSREAGTEAFDLPNQVDEVVKSRRLVKLVKLQKQIHRRVAKKKHVGNTYDVLCEGFDNVRKLYFGRSQYQAPEIDTCVFFSSREPVLAGEFYKIKINKVVDYDLEGERI